MIPYMDCPSAQARLEPFVDGELEVTEQVALEWHLRWCHVCAARVEDLQVIGAGVRRATSGRSVPEAAARTAFVRDGVLSRLDAERNAAWVARAGRAVRDRRLLWPALGATAAVVVCLLATSAVLRAATDRAPDSLADMIAVLASPGSDLNPVRLDGRISVPRALAQEVIVDAIPDEDMVLALSAVVTREGRVAEYQLLESTRASVRRVQAAAWADDLDAFLDAVGRTRFTPAQGVSGDPVAVNLVWLLTRTTVRSATEAMQTNETVIVTAPAIPVPMVPVPVVEDVPAVDLPLPDFTLDPETGVELLSAVSAGVA